MFILKSLIYFEIIQEEQRVKNFIDLKDNIEYEKYFQKLVKSIEDTTNEAQTYYMQQASNKLDFERTSLQGQKVTKEYVNFQRTYNILKEKNYSTKAIENLVYHFHKDIMNFENEALNNLEAYR